MLLLNVQEGALPHWQLDMHAHCVVLLLCSDVGAGICTKPTKCWQQHCSGESLDLLATVCSSVALPVQQFRQEEQQRWQQKCQE